MPAIGITSVIGVPATQWACSGHAPTTREKISLSRKNFSGASPVGANKVTDQVSLSPRSVTIEKLPIADRPGARSSGAPGR